MGLIQVFIVGLVVLADAYVRADFPTECMYEDVKGKWTFYMGEGGNDNSIDCNKTVDAHGTFKVELKYPNKVVDEFGNEGFWTMIYNQGFEVVVHGRKYFAFSKFIKRSGIVTSYCNETLIGWSHDVFGRDWSCFYGVRETPKSGKLFFHNGGHESWIHRKQLPSSHEDDNSMFKTDESFIERINKDTNVQWYAKNYEMFERMTVGEVKKLTGMQPMRCPPTAPVTEEVKKLADAIPDEFDWRNRSGVNYVTPVRIQGSCGSCYAFAATAMNEARLKIATGNRIDVILSPQDVLDCSPYSQECHGGFPYLIAGKYAEDYGMVEEGCNRYKEHKNKCNIEARKNCTKHYFTKYEYIGGYYGGCNEELMRLALVNHGPIAVNFNSKDGFTNYGGEIYHCRESPKNFNPFCELTHAVTIVGYGVHESTKTKYWIVKNSWGKDWGENGFFRIRRGTNECGIESLASQSFPIF